MRKISDFKLAAAVLRTACRKRGIAFVDVAVEFGQKSVGHFENNCLTVAASNSLEETLTNIVVAYVANDEAIFGGPLFVNPEARRLFLMHSAALFDHAARQQVGFADAKKQQLTSMRLYQWDFVWTLVRELICPMYDQPAKNVLVMAGEIPHADFAIYYDRVEQSGKGEEPFIFVNRRCGNEAVLQSHLLVEAIRSQGLDPVEVIRTILGSSAHSKLTGFSQLPFTDDESDEFVTVLMMILDLRPDDFPHLVKMANGSIDVKTAQWFDSPGHSRNPNWWYFGLYEKMLEPVRGPDWSVYESLEHWITDFWNEVAKIEEKKPQGEGVPFNSLLRLKVHDTIEEKPDPRRTLQELIGKHRVLK